MTLKNISDFRHLSPSSHPARAMKSNCIAALFVICSALVSAASFVACQNETTSLRQAFSSFKKKYGRHYRSRAQDEAFRFAIFKAHFKSLNAHNTEEGRTYDTGINQFSDMTEDEIVSEFCCPGGPQVLQAPNSEEVYYDLQDDDGNGPLDVTPYVNWTAAGAVSPVRNQGHSKYGWAFAAVGAVEGIHHIKTGNLVPLSTQSLVDCVAKDGDGCPPAEHNSGPLAWISLHGLSAEADYPYQGGKKSKCKSDVVNQPLAVRISGVKNVWPRRSEGALQLAVSRQPVPVAIDVTRIAKEYGRGIYNGWCDDTAPNHFMLAVGYGSDDAGRKYWLLKSSWGPEWGEDGYLRLERGVGSETGKCGIATNSDFPVMDDI
uniref:Uncharacterized protein n=1 Tax=Kalanchoe fedtschenkoi TaxID=63787 RepID=A0A7N0TJZ5_KALFE